MQRCGSWPQLFVLPAEKKGIGECNPDVQHALDALLQKEADCEELKNEVAYYEINYNDLGNRAEQLEMDKQFLIKENESLKEENRTSSERIKILEQEWNKQRLQVSELECFISNLQKNYEQVENDKRTVSEELSTQRSNFAQLQFSKKDLEGQVQQLQESTEWRRKERDRVRKLVKESDLLRAQLQEMEQHFCTKEQEARDVELLHKENHEMELQIGQMVQQNIQLRRQLKDVTQTKDHLERDNIVLREEMETLKMESSCSRDSSSPHVQCVQQEEEDLEEDHIGNDTFGDDDDYVNEFKMQILPSEDHLARTPPAISLAEEVQFSVYDAHSPGEDKMEESAANSSDALEEYIHLTAAAVKIRFHMVPISSDKLIKRAKDHPFYKMHDELVEYMKKKFQEQESAANKNEQDYHQEQEELFSIKKEEEEEQQCPEPPFTTQPSVFNKVRNLFRPRSATAQQKKESKSS